MTFAIDAYEQLKDASRTTIFAVIFLSYGVYLTAIALNRLYISPIAKFPGPKLAALSKWYEFYYDVVLRGKFSGHKTELHEIYGEMAHLRIPRMPNTAQGRLFALRHGSSMSTIHHSTKSSSIRIKNLSRILGLTLDLAIRLLRLAPVMLPIIGFAEAL